MKEYQSLSHTRWDFVMSVNARRNRTHVVLPSTSPAHAGMNFEQKLARWRSPLVNIDHPAVSTGVP